jgi:hypothetical protein
MIIIKDIINSLTWHNNEIGKIIIEETDFIDHYLHILNTIPKY